MEKSVNYQHAYHAGCIGDVFKHIVMIQLLKALQIKSNPLCYIDTHAGAAQYNLLDNPSQKTGEYKEGIARLWPDIAVKSAAINDYLEVIKVLNPDNTLNFYPGSGSIAQHYLRENDEAILCELQEAVYEPLRYHFYHDKRIHVHQREGYQALADLLPPTIKRGVVLIDPPYEAPEEYQQIIASLKKAQQRWPQGVYAVWFPIKQYDLVREFYHSLQKMHVDKVLVAECWVRQDKMAKRLNGSGMAIINPPWQFDQVLNKFLPELAELLKIAKLGKVSVNWLLKSKDS